MKKLVYILICSLILCQVASANKDYIGNTLKILDNLTPEEEFSIGKMQISELVTNRIYDSNGLCPTLTTSDIPNIIEFEFPQSQVNNL